MALHEVAIPIQFAGGVETSLDPKQVPLTKLRDLRDAYFITGATLGKRNGYDELARAIDGGGLCDPVIGLAGRGTELVGFTGADAYSYRPATDTWRHIGGLSIVTHHEETSSATGADHSMPDAATLAGVRVVAWEDSRGGVWWRVLEAATGATLRAPEQLAGPGTSSPRVVAVGSTTIMVFYLAGGVLWAALVSPDDYVPWPQLVVITADIAPGTGYDAIRCSNSTVADAALTSWVTALGDVRVAYVNAAGATTLSGLLGVAGANAVAIDYSDQHPDGKAIAVAWIVGTNAHLRLINAGSFATYDTAVAVVAGAALVRVTVAMRAAAGVTWVWVEEGAAEDTNHVVHSNAMDADGVLTYGALAPATTRGHGLASRAFVDGDDVYVIATHPATFFPYAALLRAGQVGPFGYFLVGAHDGLPRDYVLAGVEQDADDDRVWRWPGLERLLLADPSGTAQFTETNVTTVVVTFDDPDRFTHAAWSSGLVVAGSCPHRYDGSTFAELGFWTAPDDALAFTPGAGGALTAERTYLYRICYEEVDAQGQIHLGPMSVAIRGLIKLTAGQTRVTITIPTYRLTRKGRVRIGVFRSEANDESDQPSLFRVSSLDPSASGSNGYVLNDTSVDTVTFVDDLDDLSLLARERAYTNGGALSNDPIGVGGVVLAAKDRLFFTAPDDPSAIRFTKERAPGYGPMLAESLEVRAPAGPVTMLAEMDGVIYAATPTAIYAFDGPGPLDNPAAAPSVTFSPVALVTTDVGCSRPRSVATTPAGIVFQSDRGIYLLGRDRAVRYIGEPVERWNAQRIVSADTLPDRPLIVFLPDEVGDRALVYDYVRGQWSTFTNHAGKDAVVVDGVYYYARAAAVDGRVFRENRDSYLDAGVEIHFYAETAEIKLAGYIAGWQKTWYAHFTGSYLSPHTLRVRTAGSYRDGWSAPVDLDMDSDQEPDPYGAGVYGAGPYNGDSAVLYQKRVYVGLKGQSVRFQIEDVASTEPLGASFTLSELLVTGGSLTPAAKFGAARTS